MQTAVKHKLECLIWEKDQSDWPAWKKSVVHFVRIMLMVFRDLSGGMLTLRAMSLVYTTLLSLVPLLAVSFSVLKGFGVHNQIEPLLLNFLEPLGDKSVEVTNNIVGFVENMKIGVLGAVGLGLLMYTVVSLIQKIEAALNYTWRLDSVRNLPQRFSNYLSIIMVGPVLIFSAVGITASLRSHTIVTAIESLPYMGHAIHVAGLFVPYVLIISAFTFVYVLVPNTRVRLKSALYGAIVAGVLWRITGLLFASFASGSTSYTAIYSGFAILLLFMIWLYLGWLILLIGASISFYHQHPEQLRWESGPIPMSAVLRESLALQLMLEIGREHFCSSKYEPTLQHLLERLNVPEMILLRLLNALQDYGLIVKSEGGQKGFYLPTQSIDQIKLVDIIEAARQAEDSGMLAQLQLSPSITKTRLDIDNGIRQVLEGKTLKDLVA